MSNLNRFIKAQSAVYDRALRELHTGRKETHWMWFIFPQIKGLGHSKTSNFYAVKNSSEATAYMRNHTLRSRLIQCAGEILKLNNSGYFISEILGDVDYEKLRSSMTLFSVTSDNPIFKKVLDDVFFAACDLQTVSILKAND